MGDVTVKARMPWSSNATFLASVCLDGNECDAIYKPLRGERPLWDFSSGLYRREVAAYVLDVALGWGHVPETVVRADAPLGIGSLQRFVAADFAEHYFTLLEHEEHHDALRTIAVFDLLANNADRKSGHCLLGEDGRIWAIDHGVCFADEPKLRTVIWDFGGEPVPAARRDDVARLASEGLPRELDELLSASELTALRRRIDAVATLARFPDPGEGRPYPWPLV
ncbi:MAG TPA: SCO1664 family protein [Acidimicrobiales bacterium]